MKNSLFGISNIVQVDKFGFPFPFLKNILNRFHIARINRIGLNGKRRVQRLINEQVMVEKVKKLNINRIRKIIRLRTLKGFFKTNRVRKFVRLRMRRGFKCARKMI